MRRPARGSFVRSQRPTDCRRYLVLLLLVFSSATGTLAQSSEPFVPTAFEVPETLEAAAYKLRMLTVNDLVKDYDAVMSSVEHIQQVWGTRWPAGLTLEQDLIDLGWHQKEFQRRRSFAFTVVDREETRVLGCVYINPTRKQGYDAVVYLWGRQSKTVKRFEDMLRKRVRQWLEDDWPFEKVAFPGTDMDWEAWSQIPEVKR